MKQFLFGEVADKKPSRRRCKPCEEKGSYLGRRDCGWRSRKHTENSRACELFFSKCCDKIYEHDGSNGTREYLRKNPNANFHGCTSLEQTLFEDRLLSLDPSFMEVISRDPLALSPHHDDDIFIVPDIEKETANDKRPPLKFITGPKATLEFIDELDQKAMAIENKVQSNKTPSLETPLASLLGPPPESLEHGHFRNLIANGYFESIAVADETERDEIKLFANLLVRGFWDRSVIKEIFPWIDLSNFEVLKRKICLHVRKTLPETAMRFEKFWSGLTTNQREALWYYYMHNPYGRSKNFVAEKIGISVDSLKDRLSGAIKKLKEDYAELEESEIVGTDDRSHAMKCRESTTVRHIKGAELSAIRQDKHLINAFPNKYGLARRFQSWIEYKSFLTRVTYRPQINGTW